MKVVAYQDILEKRIERQKKLIALGAKRHSYGHAFHVGEVSFGCRDCFTGEQSINLFHGNKCMCHCPYCYYDKNRDEIRLDENTAENEIALIEYKLREFDAYRPAIVSFCSAGETLLYIDDFERYAKAIYPLLYAKGIRPYTFMYTNGILLDEDMLERVKKIGVNEIRFHWSASGFSDKVLENMKLAKKKGSIITVEEPAYPPNREELIKRLPVFDEIGLDHLDLIELHLTEYNFDDMDKLLPGDEFLAYKDYFYHLYDNGMTYDIMEEVLKNNYCFSVMDCNSGVERCRNNLDQDVCFDWREVDGLTRNWYEGEGFIPRLKNGKKYKD